eukprot:SAG11_NODE_51_length_19848_cov_37.780698_9_plen_178_part_00
MRYVPRTAHMTEAALRTVRAVANQRLQEGEIDGLGGPRTLDPHFEGRLGLIDRALAEFQILIRIGRGLHLAMFHAAIQAYASAYNLAWLRPRHWPARLHCIISIMRSWSRSREHHDHSDSHDCQSADRRGFVSSLIVLTTYTSAYYSCTKFSTCTLYSCSLQAISKFSTKKLNLVST